MSTSVRRAIYGKLAGDSTLNGMLGQPVSGYAKAIYHRRAPSGAAHPFVVFFKQAGAPTEAMGDPSALEADRWLVKAVDRDTSADKAEAIDLRCQALLNDAVLSISGATHHYLRRQPGDVDYDEISDGVQYQHVGSQYRLVYEQ